MFYKSHGTETPVEKTLTGRVGTIEKSHGTGLSRPVGPVVVRKFRLMKSLEKNKQE